MAGLGYNVRPDRFQNTVFSDKQGYFYQDVCGMVTLKNRETSPEGCEEFYCPKATVSHAVDFQETLNSISDGLTYTDHSSRIQLPDIFLYIATRNPPTLKYYSFSQLHSKLQCHQVNP